MHTTTTRAAATIATFAAGRRQLAARLPLRTRLASLAASATLSTVLLGSVAWTMADQPQAPADLAARASSTQRA